MDSFSLSPLKVSNYNTSGGFLSGRMHYPCYYGGPLLCHYEDKFIFVSNSGESIGSFLNIGDKNKSQVLFVLLMEMIWKSFFRSKI